MNSSVIALTEKIQTLSTDQVVEVEKFIDLLHLRDQESSFEKSTIVFSAKVSEGAFNAVWDNADDAAYDAL
jgi:hypothetical protein